MIYLTHAVYAAWAAISLALVVFAGSFVALPGVMFWTILLCVEKVPPNEDIIVRDMVWRIYWQRC